jgi:hypothetical protein
VPPAPDTTRELRGAQPGHIGKITWDTWDGEAGPDEGDFLLTPRGTSYRVISSRRSPSIRGRHYLTTEKLDQDAVSPGDPGVWCFEWTPRSPRR